MSPPLAVLDANVLYPFQLRNLLLHMAVEELFTPLWSETILEEARTNLRANRAMTEDGWRRLHAKLRAAFEDAWGEGSEERIESCELPDPDDRHVLALAIHYEAELIVTWNTKDFPSEALEPHGIEALRPPSFVDRLWKADQGAVLEAAENHRISLSKGPLSRGEYLEMLRERARLRQLANRLEAGGFLSS